MLLLHRIAHFIFKLNIPLLPKIIEGLIFFIFNSRIPSSIEIGKGTKFAYQGLSTLLVKGTVIGENCVIGMRVTTGRKFPYKNVPRIGNKVWLGVNSVIIGPVIIHDYVIIAPNAMVNKSVPEYKIVGGNPAKIIGDVRDLEYDIFTNPKNAEGISDYLS
jgi:serine O-acetyltransferase